MVLFQPPAYQTVRTESDICEQSGEARLRRTNSLHRRPKKQHMTLPLPARPMVKPPAIASSPHSHRPLKNFRNRRSSRAASHNWHSQTVSTFHPSRRNAREVLSRSRQSSMVRRRECMLSPRMAENGRRLRRSNGYSCFLRPTKTMRCCNTGSQALGERLALSHVIDRLF